jgi:hypothetical protein
MWFMAWCYRLRLTPNSSTRVLWQPPVLSGGLVSRYISGASRRMGEGNENLFYSSPWYFKRFLTCCKILRHGISVFTSHPKEGALRIFIALKNSSPWPGLKPRPLGPVASTLTTTPPRRQPVRWLRIRQKGAEQDPLLLPRIVKSVETLFEIRKLICGTQDEKVVQRRECFVWCSQSVLFVMCFCPSYVCCNKQTM